MQLEQKIKEAAEKFAALVQMQLERNERIKAEKEFTVTVDEKKEGSSNSNDENNSINLPNTGAIIGGTTLVGIGGVLTLLGASMFKKRKK